jgi:NAD(P)-dependent dehydrogenase (short-subunit alcohol dehydrogenase family)
VNSKRGVLVTGVAGGIGSATAHLFSDSGWHVIGVDLLTEGPGTHVHCYVSADISEKGEIEKVFAEIARRELPINALINNAAIQICKPLTDTSPEEWDRVMNCNVRSAFLFGNLAHPLLKKSRGTIVNVSSVHAVATSYGLGAYAASKGALLALTRTMAIEFAPDNIRVNAVLPGAIDTNMLREGLVRGRSDMDEEGKLRELAGKHLLGRVGKPDEIARLLLFLADNDQSSFLTGQAVVADGGALARLSTE